MFAVAMNSPKFQKTLDWAVFAVGTLALTTAIAATVLDATQAEYADAAPLSIASAL